MRGYLYFPGCTLRTVAKDFDASAKACAESLGMELREMQGWLCCGAVFSNTVDVLMTQSGPIRILAERHERVAFSPSSGKYAIGPGLRH